MSEPEAREPATRWFLILCLFLNAWAIWGVNAAFFALACALLWVNVTLRAGES